RVVLTDFQGEEVEIELDPSLEPQENAARWYDRAARAERARERLPTMVDEARESAAEARDLLERARRGEADREEIRRLLPDPSRPEAKRKGPALPYRSFRSTGGLEIRVGRGARHNDDLTFHHSDPDDVWLHARHAAGAHVVLRWSQEGNPPQRDLAEAAVLAANHSRARTSGSVPVDWTRRKYVRSPRKAPPGTVIPDRVQTVFVEPDPGLTERLADD
ncbi:MAG TPA: NFACT RNA binding domain-containing protein, partial [Longimicrobiales bacterium]|nr:NFACT RNA binding domain-containing protein [Longimicrobiales bacterium]